MPHTGGRQDCERGGEAETMGKGFEKERGWQGRRAAEDGVAAESHTEHQREHGVTWM